MREANEGKAMLLFHKTLEAGSAFAPRTGGWVERSDAGPSKHLQHDALRSSPTREEGSSTESESMTAGCLDAQARWFR